jgi:hypothetical protein
VKPHSVQPACAKFVREELPQQSRELLASARASAEVALNRGLELSACKWFENKTRHLLGSFGQNGYRVASTQLTGISVSGQFLFPGLFRLLTIVLPFYRT